MENNRETGKLFADFFKNVKAELRLLTARNINAALAEVCVVAVGEAHYKVVSLS